ncbi:helix-turn-helix domain-containing protein [Yersinia aleksiciae]|uniref:AraC family transcriptional regulator n=1 Tax=Yersinia aleksiciae TaxID=263819 RepID=A0A0T9T4Y9_YERAE|nr:AraC family transcriptional regulator [Yersinia aleksiciae]AKP33978.1 AraC family transcriptional regulator [Yersinia aleksiciae]MDA5498189.1 AraC family transcriptional regulator [Yersinia aleksiciae]NIL00393.1 helix-turn-helix transcriptional regulator [Yersinia aleksiciae]CFQ55909.1 AraC family transcriptional regulator [Yersinia aleksiciae]CNK61961.1 AraC family transcriptional regulator [Yersinia aleksiciae]
MKTIQFILFRQEGILRHEGECNTVPAGNLVVVDELATVSSFCQSSVTSIMCHSIDLLPIYQDLASKMVQPNKFRLPSKVSDGYKILPVSSDVIYATEQLVNIEKTTSLKFIYLYCLGLDPVYFSRLLESIVGTNNELLEFFEKNRLNPWTVSRYADELGISTRKLNFLFYEKFGMSAKQWLLDQRLKKGCELLLSTRLRVADIAMECGFSNHAHFSDSFRRRFQQCPSHMRTLME